MIVHSFTFRITLSFTICACLLLPNVSLLKSEASQGQSVGRGARPRAGKPEGTWPDLEEVKNESNLTREPRAPIPSTLRSKRNEGRPWDGRRVGDPETQQRPVDQPGVVEKQTRRAHARRRSSLPPPLYEDQFIQNFFSVALLRSATAEETTYWNNILRAGYNQNQTSLKLAAVELGKTLFESASYAARNRDAHWYVYDLYKTYLMRDPDAGGWSMWEALVPTHGREYVRRGFEESGELATLMASITLSGTASNPSSLITARVEPRTQPGNGMLSRDVSWSVPLLSLPGRNGLDLGLTLSYSSMVWTHAGPYFYFDEDNGFPSPGFRLGFPTVQRKVFDAQTGKNAYLLITPSGHRVELRQVGSTTVFEAADSSYLQLIETGASLLVRSTDGTQLSFVEAYNEYRCTQVKDRNGNYLSINYNTLGQITNITDTLGRLIIFNYDGNANLLSITQAWEGQPSHQWVSFGWSTRNMQYSFADATVVGIKNGQPVPVLTQVALNDTSYFTFDYTNSLQMSAVRNYFGTLERNATTFAYETPSGDVPRLLSSSVSARNWSGVNGVPAQVTTQYSVAGDGACVMTAPDGTIYKEYYGTGWQQGLTTLSEIWSGGVKQKWTTTAWTQDNTSVSYETNPRVTETNVYDASGNRRRTTIDYGPYAQWGLPYGVHEYAADGVTELRQTYTDYNLNPAYLDRRIIGLVSQVHLTNVSSWQGKISYDYDDPARLQSLPAAATQHDTAYNTSFTARGNVTSVSRWDATDITNATKKLTSYTGYYVTGSPASATDPASHTSSVSYGDSFSDAVDRHTFAYPTTLTDAGGFISSVEYNFDFGATTRTQSPAPAGQSQGAIQTMTYNTLAQLERVTTTNNGAYKRFWYGQDYTASYETVNNVADELYSIAVTDGLGRVIGAAGNHPGSSGGYRLVNTIYDQLGRTWKVSNPTEVNNSWIPSGDDAVGIYYTQQSYDWKGRPLVTTNPDGTTKEASYSGCGCAGGEVVTLTDEGTIDAGVAKRRQQKIYSDGLGRTVKTELLNWQGGSVYSATVNTYNVRDQVTQVRQYAGAEGSATYQDTTMTYDGYGRLKTQHRPEQEAGAATVLTYNADNTVNTVTDARGASASHTYNTRQLITGINYSAQAGITPTPNATFAYDAAGNRTSMTDGLGKVNYEYDSLSRMLSETRTFTGVSNPNSAEGKFKLSYEYNLAGRLKKFTDASNMSINFGYNSVGRVNLVTGSGSLYGGVTQYASTFSYRAWGALKSMTDGTNAVTSRSYNSRLQTQQFVIGAVTQTYNYFADGRIKFLQNLPNSNFDRSFSYDHQGRLVAAKSGGAARQDAGAVPYQETFGYDAFSNLSARSTATWNQYAAQDAAVYVNNRRSTYGYDADGRNTTIEERTYSFDAAGRNVRLEGPMWVAALEAYITVVMDSGFSGDGEKVKEVAFDYYGYNPTVTTYYLRSSVLDAIVEEINANGQKQVGYVYVEGRLLARQSDNQVTWKHLSPAGTSSYDLGSSAAGTLEFDPLGADISTSPTGPPENLQSPGQLGQTHFAGIMDSRFSDVFNTDGCRLDGDSVSCGIAAGVVNFGTGQSSFLSTGFNMATLAQSLPLKFAPTGQLTTTLKVSATEGRTTYETVWSDYLGEWVSHTPTAYSGSAAMLISTTSSLGNPFLFQNSSLQQIVPLGNLQKGLEDLLKGDCGVFVQKLIHKANSLFGRGRPHATNFWDAFSRIQDAGGYQLDHVASNAGTVSGELFVGELVNPSLPEALSAGPGTVHLTPFGPIGRSARAAEAALARARYAFTALHETLHLAKLDGYSDRELAVAAHEVDGTTPPDYKKDEVLKWSGNFDTVLKKHCAYPSK